MIIDTYVENGKTIRVWQEHVVVNNVTKIRERAFHVVYNLFVEKNHKALGKVFRTLEEAREEMEKIPEKYGIKKQYTGKLSTMFGDKVHSGRAKDGGQISWWINEEAPGEPIIYEKIIDI